MADLSLASDIKDAVADIHTEVGKSVVIRRVTYGAYIDATKPSKGKAVTATQYTIPAIMTSFAFGQIDGQIIQEGDKQCIVSLRDMTIIPTADDTLIDGSDTWQILAVKQIEVSGVVCYCKLHLRK